MLSKYCTAGFTIPKQAHAQRPQVILQPEVDEKDENIQVYCL